MRDLDFNDIVYILFAIRWTLALSVAAFAGGFVGGTLIAFMRTSEYRLLRYLAAAYIRLFQGTPLLIQLFVVFFAPSLLLGHDVDPWTAATVALVLNASAFIGEILRGAIEALPRGQTEAATALGLNYLNRMRYVILPQAARIAVPPLVGFSVQLIKSTSLTSVLGFVEITKAAENVNGTTFEPVLIFGLLAALYFVLCWPLSLLGRQLEMRLAR